MYFGKSLVSAIFGGRIQKGPFAGMKCAKKSFGSWFPKIFGAYEFNNNPDYDPYFPGLVNFGRTDANNTIGDDRGYLSFANGTVKGTFKQVEVN